MFSNHVWKFYGIYLGNKGQNTWLSWTAHEIKISKNENWIVDWIYSSLSDWNIISLRRSMNLIFGFKWSSQGSLRFENETRSYLFANLDYGTLFQPFRFFLFILCNSCKSPSHINRHTLHFRHRGFLWHLLFKKLKGSYNFWAQNCRDYFFGMVCRPQAKYDKWK